MGLLKLYHLLPVFLQNVTLTMYGFKLKRQRYGKNFKQEIDKINKIDLKSLDEVREYQFSKLIKLLEYSFVNIPFYRELFIANGLTINDFKSMDDYNKLPIIDKQIIINQKDKFISKNFKGRELVEAKTGGTTGTSLVFNYTKNTLAKDYAFVFSKSRKDYEPTDKHATFNGRIIVPLKQNHPPFWRENKAINQTLYSGYHLKEENLGFYAKNIIKDNPKFITGYPSHIYLLADYIIRNSIDISKPPERIFTSSETLLYNQREVIESAFKCKVLDFYGQGEKVTQIYECDYGNYHYINEYGINELINTVENENTISGELVATGFINYASPFIRYRTGDYITIAKNETCPCRALGPVIKSIDGRIEDIITLKNGRKIGRLDHIFKDTINIKEGQIIQRNYEELDFNIVRREKYVKKDEEKLLSNIKEFLGKDIKVNIYYVNTIEREKNGKLRAVKSLISNMD